jgi:DNA-binding IclR family transcriptional regulator
VAGNATDARRSVISKLSVILRAFSQGGAYTLSELAEHTGLPVSTTHRLATELAEWQMLERCDDRRFRPGLSLRTLGGSSCCTTSMRDRAAPVLEDLSRATGANTRLGLLDKLSVNYIHKAAYHPVSQFSPAATLPLHATAMGKVLLAFSPVAVVDTFLDRKLRAYTPYTITDSDRLRWMLKLARAHRIAVSDRELQLDHLAVAAPVFGAGGHVVASLEVMVDDLSTDLNAARPALVVAAGSLSRELERPCCECSANHTFAGFPSGLPAPRRLGARSVVLVAPGDHQTDAVIGHPPRAGHSPRCP